MAFQKNPRAIAATVRHILRHALFDHVSTWLPLVATICLALAVAPQLLAQGDDFGSGKAAYERHLALAMAGLPDSMRPRIVDMCTGKGTENSYPPGTLTPEPHQDLSQLKFPPTKLFDNMYFIGDREVAVWAITTSAGIILIDSDFATRVNPVVIEGLRELHLDPAQIKYIIVSHGYDDHYGGATYLQQRYRARVVMGTGDWNTKYNPMAKGLRTPLPKRDVAVEREIDVTLGNESVTVVPTPGHTPGTLSMLVPVTDNGVPHVVAILGGGLAYINDVAVPPNSDPLDPMRTFARSTEHFRDVARRAGADVYLFVHPRQDTLEKLTTLQHRAPGTPNPFVQSPEAIAKYLTVTAECAKAYVALKSGD